MNIWDYGSRKLVHDIYTGHSGYIFCTKFMPETGDDLVVSGAGDSEVLFYLDVFFYLWVNLNANLATC